MRRLFCLFALGWVAAAASAGVLEDVGYRRLQRELGEALPTGAGIQVTQVEGRTRGLSGEDSRGWSPDTSREEMRGKKFLRIGPPSGHATGVARDFYGARSMAPGVTVIESYDQSWAIASDGFLHAHTERPPEVSLSRVANHSWIHGHNDRSSLDLLKRLDYLVCVDDFIHVGGTNNGTHTPDVTTGSYNAVIVGKTNGDHAKGTTAVGGMLYGAGRARPDIVAPARFTSNSAPRVAGAAALLVGFAHRAGAGVSEGRHTGRRTGLTIWHAETSEAVKAALMAGASRRTNNSTGERLGDVDGYGTDETYRTDNGLDLRYGAGQLDVYRSYRVLAAGEREGQVEPRGFDYRPDFGGADGTARRAAYRFTASGTRLGASLVWNVRIDTANGEWTGEALLYDIDLQLYDLSRPEAGPVAQSAGRHDNTENIWTELVPGRRYELRVHVPRLQPDFDWDYALAWCVRD